MAEKNMNAKISVEFEETANRQQLSSGDNLPTLFGKIKKIISDLSTSAFSGSYNDLSDTPTIATTDTDGLMSAEDKTKLDNADDTYALKSKYGDTTINVGRKAETKVGAYSTAEGNNTTASSWASHAEGDGTTASSDYSHAEGKSTAASGLYSHAEGGSTTASGNNSHAEGRSTIASNYTSHAEGNATTASGNSSHAEGQLTTASGDYSHAEGNNTTASGGSSHAEGYSSYKVTQLITDFLNGNITKDDIINTWNTKKFSVAHGNESHVEGQDNLSLGHYSHTEGLYTVAIGNQSHTSGYYTKALHDNEAAYGKYNESNDNTLFSIGDGTADDARHNAFEITTTGGKLHDKDIATTDLIPTTLPANGGNADTLDGLHATDFITGETAQQLTTIDDCITAGAYAVSTVYTTDLPTEFGTWGIMDVRVYGLGIFQVIYFTGTKNIIHRSKITNQIEWTPWKRINEGGNADTVGGKDPKKIFYDNGLSADLNGATQSGCYATSPDTLNAPFSTWWLVDTTNFNNQFIVQKAYAIGNTAFTVSYIRNYANNVWSDWKEISTTPIKSVEVGGTTNIHGNFMIWKASDRKIPVYAKISGYYVSPFLIFTADDYYYYLGLCDAESHEWVANTTVSGTVFYIEI